MLASPSSIIAHVPGNAKPLSSCEVGEHGMVCQGHAFLEVEIWVIWWMVKSLLTSLYKFSRYSSCGRNKMVVKAQGTNQTWEGTLDESPWHFQTETGMSKQNNFLSLSCLDLEKIGCGLEMTSKSPQLGMLTYLGSYYYCYFKRAVLKHS